MFILFQAGVPCEWATDSQHFLLEYFDTIRKSPSQIYHSALPFCPSSSWLRKCYAMELSQEIKVVKGLPPVWGRCSRIVALDDNPWALACWNDTIAVSLQSGNIIILDAITGIRKSVLSGHTEGVTSLAFSSDGMSLVSGSNDETLKLWDVQTGGIVKTFYGHTKNVCSVSISPDWTMIASGSWDHTIVLWDVQTGERCCTMEQKGYVDYISFSPTDPECLISASGGVIQWLDTRGHQIEPTYNGSCAAFSPDGTCFVSCGEKVTVRDSYSRVTMAELPAPNNDINHCCFSQKGRYIAIASGTTAYIWDTTSLGPYLIETLTGHTDQITSLVFSTSSLISASLDQSVKFWQIGTSPTKPVATSNPKPLASASIKSVALQAKDGIVISSDSDGVVRVWDLLDGHQKCSFQTSAKGKIDMQQLDGKLIVVWYDWKIGAPGKVHVWDSEKGEQLKPFGECWSRVLDLKISGDGSKSKVFLLDYQSIQAWSLQTGELVGKAVFTEQQPDSLIVDGSRVWLSGLDPLGWGLIGSNFMGWDFGILESPPVPLPNTLPNIPHLSFIKETGQDQTGRSWVEDTITGKLVLHLPERFSEVSTKTNLRWDDRYLVAGHSSGEVSILDFKHVYFE